MRFVAGDTLSLPNGHHMAGGDADSVAVNDGDETKPEKTDKADATKARESSGSEVVVIQDTGFNISIVAPGVEPFDLPVYD